MHTKGLSMNKQTDNSAFDYFELYKQTIEKMPVHIYWKDSNFRYLSCNVLQATDAGFDSVEDIIGKTDYDLFDKQTADQIRNNDAEILETINVTR